MTDEANKSIPSLLRHDEYHALDGHGLEIGPGNTPLRLPADVTADLWDRAQGDAQVLHGVPDESYDFVFASHVLEHMEDVGKAMVNWARVLRPGGALLILVPDFELYEHGRWPSIHNADHKAAFTLIDRAGQRKDLPLYRLHHMLRFAEDGGLDLIDARVTCDGYNFAHIENAQFDQTRAGALAQIIYVFDKP